MLDELLDTATGRYRELLELLIVVEQGGLGGEGAGLAKLSARFEARQDAAREADRRLIEWLDAAGSSYQQLPRMREYQEVLRQVAERNRTLLSRARTHLALVASELAELKEGKVALAAYRPLAEQRGQRLSENY